MPSTPTETISEADSETKRVADGSDPGRTAKDSAAIRYPVISPAVYPANSSPVIPLGYANGTYFYLDMNGELRELTASQHTSLNLMGLFALDNEWLQNKFPKQTGKNEAGINFQEAAAWLLAECSKQGYFDRPRRCRSSGASQAADGSLVLHCGDVVLINGTERPSGFILGDIVYVTAAPHQRPSDTSATAIEMTALLEALQAWQWRHPDAAPRLLLGWMGAAMVCGALRWRTHGWVTGGTGTGKSSLDRFIGDLLGLTLLRAVDSTAAGLRQALGDSARPVAIDEIEASWTNNRARQVVELARLASTDEQGAVYRGSPEGRPTASFVKASFLFSSILHPPLMPQDRSRITVFDLEELRATPEVRALHRQLLDSLKDLGPKMLARIMARWDQFCLTLDCYANVISDMSYSLRVADQLGTMLAMADTLLNDAPASAETVSEFLQALDLEAFSERVGGTDHDQCIQHLAGAMTEIMRGGRRITVGELLQSGRKSAGDDDVSALASIGIKLVEPLQRGKWRPALGEPAIAVAHDHPGLNRLFMGTRWADGVWTQSLRRITGAMPGKKVMNFSSVRSRAVLVPFYVLGASDDDNEE